MLKYADSNSNKKNKSQFWIEPNLKISDLVDHYLINLHYQCFDKVIQFNSNKYIKIFLINSILEIQFLVFMTICFKLSTFEDKNVFP